MSIYIRETPCYEPELFDMPASRWISYIRSTLDVLERDMQVTGDLEKIIKRVEARTIIDICDQSVRLIIEVRSDPVEYADE